MGKKADRFTGYRAPQEELTVSQRAAHFLDWAAVHAPYVAVTYPQLVKIVMQLPKSPAETSTDVLHFIRNRVSGTKSVLLRKYKRTLITHDKHLDHTLGAQRGVSLRASVDATDVYTTTYTKKKVNVERAVAGLVEVREVIDLTALPKDAKAQVKALDTAMKEDKIGPLLEALATRPPELTEGKLCPAE